MIPFVSEPEQFAATGAGPLTQPAWWQQRVRQFFAALLRGRAAGWVLPVLALLSWQVAAQSGWLSSRILPEPWAVAQAFWTLLLSGEIYLHVKTSLGRALAGLAVGGGSG